MAAILEVRRSRWSAETVSRCNWSVAMREVHRDLELRGFSLSVWKRAGRTFVTVGERFLPHMEPQESPDGVRFGSIALYAADEAEVSAFWTGLLVGERIASR